MNTTELKASILIVESCQDRLTQLTQLIAPAGLDVMTVPSGEQALDMIEKRVPEIILLNSQLPGIDGFETCSRLKQHLATQAVPILLMVAITQSIDHRQILAVGSAGIINHPFQSEQVMIQIYTHLTLHRQQKTLWQENEQLKLKMKCQQPTQKTAKAKSDLKAPALFLGDRPTLIGENHQITEVLEQVHRFSLSPLNVLLVGESGTGKELVAQALHKGSAYAAGPFVAVNCSAVPIELAESEWFGSLRGAFTGAVKDRKGYFEEADRGTLFLDEIGEMPLLSQAKLLRALEHREIRPVGGTHLKPINIRVIAATNANLLKMIQAGTFRCDLYFRLAGCTIRIPPLQDHLEDIALLVKHFLNPLTGSLGQKKALSQPALKALESYHFPGNVRELKNIIEQAFFYCDGNIIQPEHLHFLETQLIPESQQIPPLTLFTPEKQQPLLLTPSDVLKSIQAEHALMTDEGKILALVYRLGYINNALCRQLLEVNRHRATYLLKKMTADGVLVCEGIGCATSYRLP